ncbi:MAG: amidase family protein [Pseudomonadota bacterium]
MASSQHPAPVSDPFKAWVRRASDAAPHTSTAADGPLAGLRIGVKDVIVTEDFPTRFGCELPPEAFAALIGQGDAACVAQLREAGAQIEGKTVTAELATYSPGPTVNPHAPERSPGGSSSGSAAAVAAGDVPLALATQTAGSVIRPASFCGVYGFKPSFGRYDLSGVLCTSPLLDTLGLIGNTPELLKRADSVLAKAHAESATGAPEGIQKLVLYRSSRWDEAEPETRGWIEAAFDEWRSLFPASEVRQTDLDLERLFDAQRTVHCAEVAEELGGLLERYPGQLSGPFEAMVQEGRAAAGAPLERARQLINKARAQSDTILAPGEAWLTPAAKGPAPLLAEGTGDPMFCRVWTALGVPCAVIPRRAAQGLPIGAQLVAAHNYDEALLDTVVRIAAHVANSEGAR